MVGPRTPFARDTAILNYEHDSEAEWEEEVDDPDAEELASDGERSGDEREEAGSDVDSWLAEDDEIEYQEGYDADGDMVMLAAENGGRVPGEDDDVVVVESDKVRKRREREAKKRKLERERKKKREVMLPVVKGMFWQEDVETVAEPALKKMRIQLLNGQSRSCFCFPSSFFFSLLLMLLESSLQIRCLVSIRSRSLRSRS